MRSLYLLLIIVLTLTSCLTSKIAKLSDKTCDCFDAIKFNGDTLNFQMAEQRCILQLYYGALAIQFIHPEKTYNEISKSVRSELKENCESWDEVMTLFFQMTGHKTKTKIKDQTDCEIMKGGIFKDLIADDVYLTIQDSLQIVKSSDHNSYTKSKISWIDSCICQLIPFESTDSSIKIHLKENPIFTFSIIDISNDTIIFELEYKGDYSLGQYVKMK